MGKKIVIVQGDEKNVKISRVGRSDSLFYAAYQQALEAVIEIMLNSRAHIEKQDASRSSNYSSEDRGRTLLQSETYIKEAVRQVLAESGRDLAEDRKQMLLQNEKQLSEDRSQMLLRNERYLYNYPNNIVVFRGGRGVGKSSAMLTFSTDMKYKAQRGIEFQQMIQKAQTKLCADAIFDNASFLVLPPIDPTLLEKGDSILVTILARLFEHANSYWKKAGEKKTDKDHAELRTRLITSFSACQEQIEATKNPSKIENSGLEKLARLGDSANLKLELNKLVELFLEFCKKGSENAYLVLQIDDTDMNVNKAYEILEDIRKHLMIPRVIILAAADIEHLSRIVARSFAHENQSLSRTVAHGFDHENQLQELDPPETTIARQYIEKLFPQTRQIHLPELDIFFREHSTATTIDYQDRNGVSLLDWDQHRDKSQRAILRMVYQKTGMLFLPEEGDFHLLIPNNMRMLSNFFSILGQMKPLTEKGSYNLRFYAPFKKPEEKERYNDIKKYQVEFSAHKELLTQRLENVQRFKDYFLYTWAEHMLEEPDLRILKTLVNQRTGEKVNYVCSALGNQPTGESSYRTMCDLLIEIDRTANTTARKKFTFAIRTYISFVAHISVLEDLITFYDEALAAFGKVHKASEDSTEALLYLSGKSCGFEALRKIFGRDPFDTSRTEGQKAHYIDIPTKVEDAPLSVALQWTMPDLASCERALPDFYLYLTKLLSDSDVNASGTLHLELFKPIINCIYMSEAVTSKQGGTKSLLNASDWQSMQERPLALLLNSELQPIVGEYQETLVHDEGATFLSHQLPRQANLETASRSQPSISEIVVAIYSGLDALLDEKLNYLNETNVKPSVKDLVRGAVEVESKGPPTSKAWALLAKFLLKDFQSYANAIITSALEKVGECLEGSERDNSSSESKEDYSSDDAKRMSSLPREMTRRIEQIQDLNLAPSDNLIQSFASKRTYSNDELKALEESLTNLQKQCGGGEEKNPDKSAEGPAPIEDTDIPHTSSAEGSNSGEN